MYRNQSLSHVSYHVRCYEVTCVVMTSRVLSRALLWRHVCCHVTYQVCCQGLEEREWDEEHSSSDDLLDGEDCNNKDSDVPMEAEEEEEEVRKIFCN